MKSIDAQLKEILKLRRQVVNTRKLLHAQERCLANRESTIVVFWFDWVNKVDGKTLSATLVSGKIKIRKRALKPKC